MEQKRLVLFMVCAAAILFGWQVFILPRIAPPRAKPDFKKIAEKVNAEHREKEKQEQAGADELGDKAVADGTKPEGEQDGAKAEPENKPLVWKAHPHQEGLTIGSLDPDSGFRMLVTLDSRGAVVSQIELNDKRYQELEKPFGPLRVVGADPAAGLHTLQTVIPALDRELLKTDQKTTSSMLDWEVVPGSKSEKGVTFRLVSPDGKFEVLKQYELAKVDPQRSSPEAPAYDLHFEMKLRNLGDEARAVSYDLQGPVGLPLEGKEYSRKYRDVVAGFREPNQTVKAQVMTAKQIATDEEKGKIEEWKTPLQYIGVDIQYFASVLVPEAPDNGDPTAESFIDSSQAMIVGLPRAEKSDVSVRLTSKEIELKPANGGVPSEVVHKYLVFAGPKRENLLRPIGAEKIIDYGMAGRIGVTQGMLLLLGFLHDLFPSWAWPYGWAIILLTVVVRSAMFPFSRKQAMSAAKMQEIQPEIAALKKKYGNDTEKLGKAQMELFRKHNYNPFGGCLIMFVQLPIFIGLYQALNISVDLRSAKFLWIHNLAAPDALFKLPFTIPFVDSSTFNVLPLITIALFIVQQKMFMPPPTDEQQEMQQKMMSYMMIFMGFMFYSVPAGLCIYFISSSLWGLAERKLLPKPQKKTGLQTDEVGSIGKGTNGTFSTTGVSRTTEKRPGKGKSKQRR